MPRASLVDFSLTVICLLFVLVSVTRLGLVMPLALSRYLDFDFLRPSISGFYSGFDSGSKFGFCFGILLDFRQFLLRQLHPRLRSFLNAKARMVRHLAPSQYSTIHINARFHAIPYSMTAPRPAPDQSLSLSDIRRSHPHIYRRLDSTSSLTINGPLSPESAETSIALTYIQRSVKQSSSPQMSATLLIVITAGTLFAFSLLAAVCYLCARCRTRKQRAREKEKEKRASLNPGKSEKGKRLDDLEIGRTRTTATYGTRSGATDSGLGPSSPSAFEFSPPSPTWRPTLPSLSLAHFASASASASSKNWNWNGNGNGNGRGEILDAETIMREREPGRRRMVFGVDIRPGITAPAPTFPPPVSGTKSKMKMHTQVQMHPYAQAQPFPGKVGAGVGISVPGAPPAPGVSAAASLRPTHQPLHRPPQLPKAVAYQYCRQSRIVPRVQQVPTRGQEGAGTASEMRSASSSGRVSMKAGSRSCLIPDPSSTRGIGGGAGPAVSLAVPSAKMRQKEEGEHGARTENKVMTARPKMTTKEATVPVPRIEVHLAGDERNSRGHQGQGQGQGRNLNKAGGGELKRNHSVSSQNQSQNDLGRPRSGLGISTIDLGVGSGGISGPTKASARVRAEVQLPHEKSGSRSRPGSRTRTGSTGRNGSRSRSRSRGRAPSPSSPVTPTPSDDDVRLPYTLSVISLQPKSELDSKLEGGDNLSNKVGKERERRKSRVEDRTQNLNVPEKLKTEAKDVSNASITMSRSKRLSATQRRSVASPSLNLSARRTNPDTGAGGKRQALGAGAIDPATKSELHDMRSLGSESFDSLIAYLEESAIAEAFQPGPDGFAEGDDGEVEMEEDEAIRDMTGRREDTGWITREETVHVDEASYKAWLGSLDASPSALRLAHVEIPGTDAPSTSTSTVRSGRRGRSASESVGRIRGPPLREQDTNVPDSRRSRSASRSRGHARNKSVAGTDIDRERDRGRDASIVTGSAATRDKQAKVGIQDRALRARSTSLKTQNRDKRTLTSAPASDSADADATSMSSFRPRNDAEGSHISTRGRLDDLLSFSVPSTAAQLFEAFPENATTLSGSASTSLNGNGTGYDDRDACRAPRAAAVAKAKKGTKAMTGSSSGSKAGMARATCLTTNSSSRTIVGSVSLTSNSTSTATTAGSNPKANLMKGKTTANANLQEAISSAKYIARCAPTPHLKSAAALSFFSPCEPSSPLSHPRSRSRRHGPGHEQSDNLHPDGPAHHQRRSPDASPVSIAFVEADEDLREDESESSESDVSTASTWGRRSEWGRESLTPRFDHLRAVLEGRFEDPPPLPLPRR